MDFIGGLEGMKFTPISNYNNMLKNNAAFDVNSNLSFESILDKQTAALQNSSKVQGGIDMNVNFEDIMANAVQSTDDSGKAGSFLGGFSKSIGSGLNSVNNSVLAASKAQEAMAMGEDVSVHDVMIATEKANLSMQMALQLRNKLVSAYNEINNVRV